MYVAFSKRTAKTELRTRYVDTHLCLKTPISMSIFTCSYGAIKTIASTDNTIAPNYRPCLAKLYLATQAQSYVPPEVLQYVQLVISVLRIHLHAVELMMWLYLQVQMCSSLCMMLLLVLFMMSLRALRAYLLS